MRDRRIVRRTRDLLIAQRTRDRRIVRAGGNTQASAVAVGYIAAEVAACGRMAAEVAVAFGPAAAALRAAQAKRLPKRRRAI
jgi:hypothetical protein